MTAGQLSCGSLRPHGGHEWVGQTSGDRYRCPGRKGHPLLVLSERISHVLASLGDTADEVAGNLRAAGDRGVRGDCSACPVARRIAAEVPELGGDFVVEWAGVTFCGAKGFVECPYGVRQFIAAFDLGHAYPDLAEVAS